MLFLRQTVVDNAPEEGSQSDSTANNTLDYHWSAPQMICPTPNSSLEYMRPLISF